jgi:hypothetical protein
MILWRPVGLAELVVMYRSSMVGFPPRLPGQDILYVVLRRSYAEKIAREWNTHEPPFAGYVTEFEIPDPYAQKFETHIVGDASCAEFWVPASGIDEFNAQIVGPVRVVSAHFGEAYTGHKPRAGILAGASALDQLAMLVRVEPFDFACEVQVNRLTVFVNLPYWETCDIAGASIPEEARSRIVERIRAFWRERLPEIELPLPPRVGRE